MKTISLTRGLVAIVDDEDYEQLAQYAWQAKSGRNGSYYATRRFYDAHGKRHRTYMAIDIMHPPSGMLVDHISGNTLDNRRSNLRVCTCQQSNYNKGKYNAGRNRYKGVSWDVKVKKWWAYIDADKCRHSLGYFVSELDAAQVYNRAALELHGEFARLNHNIG
jgi:hypothetical protein